MIDPWKGTHFKHAFAGEYLPAGEHSWRYVRDKGGVAMFETRDAAREAAKQAYLSRYESPIRATLPPDPDKLEARLAADAEQWLQSRRSDVKAAEVVRRPGKKPFQQMQGRAR